MLNIRVTSLRTINTPHRSALYIETCIPVSTSKIALENSENGAAAIAAIKRTVAYFDSHSFSCQNQYRDVDSSGGLIVVYNNLRRRSVQLTTHSQRQEVLLLCGL
jgi:hypothetical protein